MPTYQTKGIVIGRTNFGEADRIVRFLTPDRGKLSAVAKGSRKLTSRAAGHLEPLGEVNLMLAMGRNLDVITSARLLWYPHSLTQLYPRLSLALAMTTAIDRLTEPGQPHAGLYRVLGEALHALEAGAEGSLPELWFKLQLAASLGYRPDLAGCGVCSRTNADVSYSLNPERGGLVCQADSDPGCYPLTQSTIKLWRLLLNYPYETIAHITGAAELATTSLSACNAFYEHHLGYRFLNSD